MIILYGIQEAAAAVRRISSPISETARYWIGDTGNWNDNANWSTTSGGSGGAAVPTAENPVIFDANSFSTDSQICTIDASARCLSIDMSAVDQLATIAVSNDLDVYGSFLLGSNITMSGTSIITLQGEGSHDINSYGCTITAETRLIGTGNYTVQSDLIFSRIILSFTGDGFNGVFDANDYDLTFYGFGGMGGSLGDWYMGNGTWHYVGGGSYGSNLMNFYGAGNLFAEDSTVHFDKTGTDTQYVFYMDDKSLNTLRLSNIAEGYVNYNAQTITINDLIIDPSVSFFFDGGGLVNISNSITAIGSLGNLITITDRDSIGGTFDFNGAGVVELDYCDISYSSVTPANTWYAGANSIDSGNNSGWIFGPYTQEYFTLYNSFSTIPDASAVSGQSKLVKTLKDASVWQKMDLFYVFANDASDNALLNWVDPTLYDASYVNTPLGFTAYEGYEGDGVGWLDTQWSPTTDASNFQSNNLSFGIYVRQENGGVESWIGNDVRMHMLTTNDIFMRIQSSGNDTDAPADPGMWIASRESSNSADGYFNDASIYHDINESNPIVSDNFRVMNEVDNNYPADIQASMAFTGGGLSRSDVVVLTYAFETYMDTLGKGIISDLITPEYQTIYNSFSTKPTTTIMLEQDRLVKTLVDASIWDKMDVFYVFANDASDNALINWINPGTFNADIIANPPTFDAYEGFTGNGTDQWISTNFNPSTDASNYSLNNASAGAYLRNHGINGYPFANGNLRIAGWNGAVFSYRLNTGTNQTFSADSSIGMLIISRDASNNSEGYYNLSSGGTSTVESTSVQDAEITLLRYSITYSDGQISNFFVGSSFTDSDVSIFTNAFETYMDYIGKGII